MKRIRLSFSVLPVILMFAAILAATVAYGQSSPGLVYGQVPTAAQWNSYFALKQDTLLLPANSLLGNSTASSQSVRYITMPSGCTASNNALIWVPNVGWSCNTIAGGGTINAGTQNAIPFYALPGTTLSAVASINNGTLITNSSGVPSFSLTLPPTVQGNISTVGTIASGAWQASPVTVPYGGTGISVFTSGGIPYASSTTTIASSGLLAANSVVLGGGAGVAPSTLATANNGTLVTNGSGVPSISSTLPTAVMNNITRTGTLAGGATGGGFTVALGASTITGVLPASNGGAGTINGALKADGAGLVTQAACADLSNGATGCSTATGTSGATIPLLNGTNTWSGVQSHNVNTLVSKGSTSGTLTLNAAAIAGTGTITFPAGSTDFSATGGTSRVLKQVTAGAAITVAQLACADLSDSGTGCTTTVGTAASAATGTSGHVLGFLDGANTWSAAQTHSAGITVNSGTTALQALTATTGNFTGAFTLGTAQVLKGYAAAQTIAGAAPGTQFAGTGTDSNYLFGRYSANTNAINQFFYKSRAATIAGSAATLLSGDNIASFNFYGDDGTSPTSSSSIIVSVEGTLGTGILPGKFKFQTANSSGTLADALTLNSSQVVTAGAGFTLSSGVASLPNGLVGAPSLNLGDATTGIYRVASGQIGITSGGVLQGTWLSTGLTMNANTVTFGDGATWAATGLNDTATYTTASTDPFHLNYTMSYSSTSNGISGMALSPKMNPTGASGGNMQGISASAQLVTSAANVTTFRGINFSPSVASSYTGTVSQIENIIVGGVTNGGSNTVPTGYQIHFSGNANGNGITTGTVNNYGIALDASTAAAASGGTLVNYAISSTVPTGSGAGTTSNFGFRITGNGGSGGGGTTTNFALYSDSTAASALAGGLAVGSTTAFTGGLTVASANSFGTLASVTVLDQATSAGGRVLLRGPNASTNATFSLVTQRSDASNSLTLLSGDTSGGVNLPQTTNIGTASTDYVTVAGGASSTSISTNGGDLNLAPNSGNGGLQHASTPSFNVNATGAGSGQKIWDITSLSANFKIRAVNDAYAGATDAYVIAHGTTYNVASHTWYTSTSAGTPVQKFQITTTSAAFANKIGVNSAGGATAAVAIGSTTQGGIAIEGTTGISGYTANTFFIDVPSANTARFSATGTDASTNGAYSILSTRSDGSNSLTILSTDTSANVTSSRPWTLSNTAVKLTGITTGTNAFTVCMASDGTLLVQAAACTISTMALKVDLGVVPFDPAAALRKINVAYYRYKDEVVSDRDVNTSLPKIGLYAENVAAAIPFAAVYRQDGKTVQSYDERAVIGTLVGGWNSHDVEISHLKAANDDLRASNDNLAHRVELLETASRR